MEYNPSNSDAVTKSWRYTFNNRTTSQNIAIRLDAEPSLTNMSIKYGYDTEKLDNANNADKKTDKYEAQMLTPGQSINVYIIASVTDSSKVASYIDKINWRIGEGATTTIVNQDGTETTDHVIKGMPVNEALPAIQPSVADCEFEGWYLDEDLTIPVTNMSQTNGAKVYPRVPNLPADWLILSGDQYTVDTGNSALPENLVIPTEYNGKPVTKIGREAFKGNATIKTVNLPIGINYIDTMSFQNCTSLVDVYIPESVENFRSQIFRGCSSLTSIHLPESITSFSSDGFQFSGCTALKYVKLPSSMTEIPKSMFASCVSLTDINIPAGVTIIRDRSFVGCNSLKNITIPSSIVVIEKYSFNSCTNLVSVGDWSTFTNLTTIGDYVFQHCSALTGSITIPASVTTMGKQVFRLTGYSEIKLANPTGWYYTSNEDFSGGTSFASAGVDLSNATTCTNAIKNSHYAYCWRHDQE